MNSIKKGIGLLTLIIVTQTVFCEQEAKHNTKNRIKKTMYVGLGVGLCYYAYHYAKRTSILALISPYPAWQQSCENKAAIDILDTKIDELSSQVTDLKTSIQQVQRDTQALLGFSICNTAQLVTVSSQISDLKNDICGFNLQNKTHYFKLEQTIATMSNELKSELKHIITIIQKSGSARR